MQWNGNSKLPEINPPDAWVGQQVKSFDIFQSGTVINSN
jgi:hypothetical protein